MSPRYEQALRLIDEAHSEDPNRITTTRTTTATINEKEQEREREREKEEEEEEAVVSVPYELHYARKMTSYLDRVDPSASEVLRLSVRAQHFRRWEVPRNTYPMTRSGYLAWRTRLKTRQAEQAERICSDCGYSETDAARVAALIRKEGLNSRKKDKGDDDDDDDNETQTLEDVACLVFLDDQLERFEKEHDEEKIVGILKKTWVKMSDKGHELALRMNMSDRARELVTKALS